MSPRRPNLFTAILNPATLLAENLGRWAPLVVGFSFVSAIPEILVRIYAPEGMRLIGGGRLLDTDMLVTALMALLVMLGAKFVVEFATFMFVFVILADLTAGRPPDLGAGLRRLASWRLQFVWLVAGLFEQTAISLWFIGGALLLIPVGLVTTAAYEEDSGMAAFGRSMRLGMGAPGVPISQWPGVRLAAAVTVGFVAGAALQGAVSAFSFASSGVGDPAALATLLNGGMPDLEALLPSFGPLDAVIAVLTAPLALAPTIYMMTAQQLTYWETRRAEPAGGASSS